MELLWDIVEENLDEADFLWGRWETALSAHDQTLSDVSKWVEERLLGHLDGLRLGAEQGIKNLLGPALESDDLGRVSAAAHVMATAASEGEVLGMAFLAADGKRLQAIRRGIEVADCPTLLTTIESRLKTAAPHVQAAFLDIRTFRREDAGPLLTALLSSDDPVAQAAAARAVRNVRSSALNYAEVALRIQSPAGRNAAIETGIFLGHPAAWKYCLELVRSQAPACEPLLLLTALLGTPRDCEALLVSLANDKLRKAAIWALGFAGTPRAAEGCLDLLARNIEPRLAGEAFCAVTGLDLAAANLVLPEPADDEEDDDAPVAVPTADDRLPVPEAAGVVRWWKENRKRFTDGERYLGGKPRTAAVIQEAIEGGPTRRRHALALEMAIRTAGLYRISTTAFTGQQRREMKSFAALTRSDFRRNPHSRYFSAA